jgi:hypothetical protein
LEFNITITVLPKDIENTPIQGSISGVPTIVNIPVASGVWTPVSFVSGSSKQIILQCRDQVDWYFSTTSGNNDFFTFRSNAIFSASIVTTSGSILGWVKIEHDSVMELLVGT